MNREEQMTFMKLPQDLVLNCLARVSRLHYQTLSLVSKRFRSLLASTELYKTRTLIGYAENCLYVCLKLPTNHNSKRWFTLCLKPNSSKKVLVPITSPNSLYNTYYSDIASVGSNIYSIGGFTSRAKASSTVMVMECHSNTWSEAPSMRMAREVPSVCVLDGKIYVTGGCKNLDASNLMEVFDTKSQTWEFVRCGNSEKVGNGYMYQSTGYDGTLYVQCLKSYQVYKLHEGSYRRAGDDLAMQSWRWSSSACMVGNVLYTCSIRGMILWYDSEVKHWKVLKGLERRYCDAKLVDYGGKLAICWKENMFANESFHGRNIWCGEVEIVKREGGEIWGRLKWSNTVFTTNEPFSVARVLAVTL